MQIRNRRAAAQDRLIEVMATDPQKRWHLVDLWRATSLRLGRIIPALDHLEQQGVVTAYWDEQIHPRRRAYSLVDRGETRS